MWTMLFGDKRKGSISWQIGRENVPAELPKRSKRSVLLTVLNQPVVFAVQGAVTDQQNLMVQVELATDALWIIVDTVRVVAEGLNRSAVGKEQS